MLFENYLFETEHNNKTAKKSGSVDFSAFLTRLFVENENAAVQILHSPLFRNYINEKKALESNATLFYLESVSKTTKISEPEFIDICNKFCESSFIFGVKSKSQEYNQRPFLANITTNVKDLSYFKDTVKDISNQKREPLSQSVDEHIQLNLTINTSANTCLAIMLKPQQLLQIARKSDLKIRVKLENILGISLVSELSNSELEIILETSRCLAEHLIKLNNGEVQVGLPDKFKLSSISAKRKIKPIGTKMRLN